MSFYFLKPLWLFSNEYFSLFVQFMFYIIMAFILLILWFKLLSLPISKKRLNNKIEIIVDEEFSVLNNKYKLKTKIKEIEKRSSVDIHLYLSYFAVFFPFLYYFMDNMKTLNSDKSILILILLVMFTALLYSILYKSRIQNKVDEQLSEKIYEKLEKKYKIKI